ncbi:hypothetical protein FACS1894170_12510 [Planctomycetales bacterium]|nr:hypothetical protein FACS1894170_12510 [Planctomycetales bacterium]
MKRTAAKQEPTLFAMFDIQENETVEHPAKKSPIHNTRPTGRRYGDNANVAVQAVIDEIPKNERIRLKTFIEKTGFSEPTIIKQDNYKNYRETTKRTMRSSEIKVQAVIDETPEYVFLGTKDFVERTGIGHTTIGNSPAYKKYRREWKSQLTQKIKEVYEANSDRDYISSPELAKILGCLMWYIKKDTYQKSRWASKHPNFFRHSSEVIAEKITAFLRRYPNQYFPANTLAKKVGLIFSTVSYNPIWKKHRQENQDKIPGNNRYPQKTRQPIKKKRLFALRNGIENIQKTARH